ncbi:DUF3606 domain-containing protein [Sphingobium sp. HBC34]|uniref:DUF3606 domain-containing protein n=1 Tax=Sphingobium cyanobacteriorum TaxID=3063954 RepID=A0ABT8ZIA7_9SPHN|nr:DUF3606 domain-containing protein [Sphingobium sp. HBC34]MDO7834259.1 DUF3606 domain-containing protein [Sphingobium sp. HBC34]
MTDNQDDGRVALECEAAVLYWTYRFGVTRDELEEAVEMVGDDADAVAAYLNIAR